MLQLSELALSSCYLLCLEIRNTIYPNSNYQQLTNTPKPIQFLPSQIAIKLCPYCTSAYHHHYEVVTLLI